MTILDEIAAATRERIEAEKRKKPFNVIRREAESEPKEGPDFEGALRREGLSFICEVKKASPSKGVIAPIFPYISIAREYAEAGADAISVLTEPKWFLGDNSYLREITENINTPCLRKDFTIDPYMICEAKLIGAAAVLLIVSLLSEAELREYREMTEDFGLSALVETHDAKEIETALRSGAKIIGVNNRNLKDFSVDTGNSKSLRELVPKEAVFVSESGIQTPDDTRALREAGVDAVLIGEALMRAENKKEMLEAFRN